MSMVFDSASRYVIVYSSNENSSGASDAKHVWHRRFTDWMEANRPNTKLISHIPSRYLYSGNYRKSSFAELFCPHKRGK
jgi:hypothetical protein